MKIKEMMKRKGFAKIALLVGVATLWLGLVIPSAHALSLTPGDYDWLTNDPSFCDLNCVEGLTGASGLSLLYKADVGTEVEPEVVEEGSLAGSYETTFSNSAFDPANFVIDYIEGQPYASCPTCILVVKDGKHDPAQYLFDLGSWNGQDDIEGTGFWYPGEGAISNVAIYGKTTSVPEPSSLLLLGSGILSLGVIGRKLAKRKS